MKLHVPTRGRSRPRASSRRGSTSTSRRPTRRSRARSRRADVPPWARELQAAMFDAGWLLPGQPPEFGGRNAPLLEQFVIQDELTQRRIYHSFNPQGVGIIAPSILMFGTAEQKQRWAVPLLRAEITAALGMSEPNAGSDLAGLRTRAVLDGDEFVVNGQKVWTSGAHDADIIFTFVRTDPDAPKHKGISALIIPTDTARRHAAAVRLDHEPDDLDFNEVFFDDVARAGRQPRRRTQPGMAGRHRRPRRGAGDALAEPVRTPRRRRGQLRRRCPRHADRRRPADAGLVRQAR